MTSALPRTRTELSTYKLLTNTGAHSQSRVLNPKRSGRCVAIGLVVAPLILSLELATILCLHREHVSSLGKSILTFHLSFPLFR